MVNIRETNKQVKIYGMYWNQEHWNIPELTKPPEHQEHPEHRKHPEHPGTLNLTVLFCFPITGHIKNKLSNIICFRTYNERA